MDVNYQSLKTSKKETEKKRKTMKKLQQILKTITKFNKGCGERTHSNVKQIYQ